MEYKIITTAKGPKYIKGNRFCSVKDIPEDVLQRLSDEGAVDTSRDCVFCGQPGTEEKTLNSIRYYLCLNDYNQRTTGELAQTIAYRTANPNN